ncbi:MAG TPA: PKD domain-containing protein [Vicinamibacteria bacterium]|nr:PKD domain-containing protein [Vicinamibacteria bacterium]
MTGRSIWVGLILTTLTPTIARSQGLEIDHKAVGCIVVGKYPKMNACFTPVSNLAKSRVYFRPEGTPSWYYVEMKSDQPCLTGILPKPGKKLVGKHVEYYLEAQNKAFNPSRTAEYAPIVVRSAQECKKDIPIAPFLNNATVAVFPSVPAGFVGAGGIGTAAVVGIVGAGAAAATTAVVVANNNDDNTTTTIASSVNPTTTAPTVTTTLITTTTLPKLNHAPSAVLRTKPDPPQGLGPLTVIFDMCGSSDSDGDPLTYFFEFGDGNKTSGSSCVESHTYSASFREASAGKVKGKGNVTAQDSTYTFEGSVVDPSGASGSRSRTVVATKPAPACGSPSVSVSVPACQTGGSVGVTVTATDPGGISNVTVKGVHTGDTFFSNTCVAAGPQTTDDTKTATGGPPTFTATLTLTPPSSFGQAKCYDIGATVTNSCGTTANASKSMYVASTGCPPTYPYPVFHDVRRGMAWESDLQVEGGRLQLVVNGSAVSYPEQGRGYGMGAFVDGENRVEATLVEGRGKAGVWRFNFLASQSIAAGSLRVIAGDAVEVGGSSISFRLKGTPGERVAFTFEQK